jgi:hypothetical protein
VKVKELIRLLQEEDPESEACVHNADIESVYATQAYWDGRLQVLERDAEGYVVGGKYTSKGWKVNICPSSITEQIWGDPDFKVDYSELGGSAERYIESDNKTRQASRDVIRKVAMEGFYRWAKKKAEEIRDGDGDIRYSADKFWEENLHVDDPLPELPKGKRTDSSGKEYEFWPSVCDRQEHGWNQTIEVYWRGGWGLRFKNGSADSGEY